MNLGQEVLHKYLLKKIDRNIDQGQSVLHLSNAQEQITDLLKGKTQYLKAAQLADLEIKKKVYGFVIADMEIPDLDDFDAFVNYVKTNLLIPGGMLIIIAANLASFENIVALIFNNDLPNPNLKRPYRAISPGFLREKLLLEGFAIQNRFWIYGDKMMVMANLK